MSRRIHTFANGVRVYDDHLLEEQRERYRRDNVHEAEEEDIFREILGQLPADGCFVNVGAAIGYYLILARKLAPRLTIHALEPLPRHGEFLLENLALNGLTKSDIHLHAEALAGHAGAASFADRGYSSRLAAPGEMTRLTLSARWKRLLERVGLRRRKPLDEPLTVTTLTLDEFVRQRVGGPVDLLQMDVQGAEAEVLRGGREVLAAGEIHNLLIGTHGRARGLTIHEECREFLRSLGYTIAVDLAAPESQPDGILLARR